MIEWKKWNEESKMGLLNERMNKIKKERVKWWNK